MPARLYQHKLFVYLYRWYFDRIGGNVLIIVKDIKLIQSKLQ